ncbi:MAG: hypothetical protein RL266_2609 [Bacteroidota bacterium]|jgi:folate-dependent phosphoribosylglycinamide formyltransferase PurN
MSVVLLTNNSNRGQALAHLLLQHGVELKLVVVEDPGLLGTSSSTVTGNLKKLMGPTYRWLKDRLLLSHEDRKALKYESESIENANRKVEEYIADLGLNGRPHGLNYLETASLSESTVVNAIKNAEPLVCVVLGTSILKQRLLSIPKFGTVNAHTSILPEYRGARSEFWQCFNQDYDHVGVTLHFIDKGIDTGSILFQWKQEVGSNPDPNMLRANNTIATLKNYPSVVLSVLNGTCQPKPQGQGATPTYRFKDITLEKRLKLYSRIASNRN